MFFAPKTAWNGWGGFTGEQAMFLITQGTFGEPSRRRDRTYTVIDNLHVDRRPTGC